MKISQEEFVKRQEMKLDDKIDFTCNRIEQWYDYWKGNIYISFSGGKDSTVLLDIVRNKSFLPNANDIPAVYNDTGLEYPEIKEFVKTFENVVVTRPKLTYRQVIEKYGYAVISKEQSSFIQEYRDTKSDKLKDIRINGNKWGRGKISKKWLFMLNAPFKISDKCCDVLKKDPSKIYERKTNRHPILGIMADESAMRRSNYIRFGCNAFDTKRPFSMPLAFWTEQDILQYIIKYKLKIPSVYGNILKDEKENYYLTGVQRTGCMWCLFGIEKDKQESEINRIQRLKITHPKIYNYCINNLGLGDVLDFMEIEY